MGLGLHHEVHHAAGDDDDLDDRLARKLGGDLLVLFGGLSLVGIVLFALIDDIVLADWLWTIVGWVWVAAAMALQAVLVAVSYYHLRVAKEGTGIDEIAAVFD